MVTKVNDTVLDLNTPPIQSATFDSLSVNLPPTVGNDVVNLTYFQGNAITSSGGNLVDSTLLFEDGGATPLMELNVGNGDAAVGPDIAFIGDGYTNCGDDMYIGFDANGTGNTLQFIRGGATVPASEVVGEFGNGWLRITRPDQPGTPDDSVYLLLDQQASGSPAPGGAGAPSVIFHNPDQGIQGHAYDYTRLQNEDGSILKVRAGTLLDGTGDVDLMSIMQAVSPYFDFHAHLLKNVLDPVDAQDVATKAYADGAASGIGITTSSFGPVGYVRFGNGYTIQWGLRGAPISGGVFVTFPIPFTTTFVVVTQADNGNPTSYTVTELLDSPPLPLAGFNLAAIRSNGTGDTQARVYWVAHGIS